jgi:ferredoxin
MLRMSETWTLADLKTWTESLLASKRVVAPVAGPRGAVWSEIGDPGEILWEYGRTVDSPRSWLLPPVEPLFSYDLGENPPRIEEAAPAAVPTVLMLLRPCDVAGLRALDGVMRWDFKDPAFEARREATLLVSLACADPPAAQSCFCTATGIDPRRAADADISIERLEGNGEAGFRVYALTEAGRAALAEAPRPASPDGPVAGRLPDPPVDLERARAWMRSHFDDPAWEGIAQACVGCGTCAFLCPTCHCFDVSDEGDWRRGVRLRFRDSCAFSHFTVHATGHNPRPRQANRYRQRVYHKMIYYPDKFGPLLCTGCGRCIDACPAGVDLLEVLQDLASRPEPKP